MAVDVAPEAADAVEIAVAVAVDQVHSLGGGDDQRLIRQPLLHVRERMPDILAVELAKGVGIAFSFDDAPHLHTQGQVLGGRAVADGDFDQPASCRRGPAAWPGATVEISAFETADALSSTELSVGQCIERFAGDIGRGIAEMIDVDDLARTEPRLGRSDINEHRIVDGSGKLATGHQTQASRRPGP